MYIVKQINIFWDLKFQAKMKITTVKRNGID